MFSTRSIERLAGAFLVASFVVFVGVFITVFILGAASTTILLVLVYGLLITLSAIPLYLTFRQHEQTLALFSSVGLVAHGLFIVLACALILAQLEFAQEFAVGSGAEADTGVAATSALEVMTKKIRYSAVLFLGLALVPLGALIAWSGAVARWLGWLGVVSGILGFLVLLAKLFDVVVGAPSMLMILAEYVFILILGVRLLVRETREATAT